MRFQSTGKRLQFGAPDRDTLLLGQPRVFNPRRPQLNGLPVLKNRGGGSLALGNQWVAGASTGLGQNAVTSKNGVSFILGQAAVPLRRTTDFINYTSPTGLDTTMSCYSMDYSPSQDLWVLIDTTGPSSTKYATSSDNGATWTMRTFPTARRWETVYRSERLGLWIVFGTADGADTSDFMTSTNGTTWTSRTFSVAQRAGNIADNGSVLVAAGSPFGGSEGLTSTDGINWTLQGANGGYGGQIIWVPQLSRFVVQRNNNEIFLSSDGVSWAGRSHGRTGANGGLAVSSDGLVVMCRMINSTPDVPYFYTSRDLVSWNNIVPSFTSLYGVGTGTDDTKPVALVWDTQKKLFVGIGSSRHFFSP